MNFEHQRFFLKKKKEVDTKIELVNGYYFMINYLEEYLHLTTIYITAINIAF